MGTTVTAADMISRIPIILEDHFRIAVLNAVALAPDLQDEVSGVTITTRSHHTQKILTAALAIS